MVFKGIYGWQSQWDDTSVNINDMFYLSCPNCQAHAGAVQAYQEAKEATNDWATVKQAVNETGHQWSITGHGFAGMVAQVASLDLVSYSSSAAQRILLRLSFSPAARISVCTLLETQRLIYRACISINRAGEDCHTGRTRTERLAS